MQQLLAAFLDLKNNLVLLKCLVLLTTVKFMNVTTV